MRNSPRRSADAAEEKAQAAADALAGASGADILTQAELKKKEEATAAAAKKAAEKREKFEVEFDAVSNFEFPEFTVSENQKKVAGAAIVGGLGAAGLVAEADVAQGLINVGGEAMMATAAAFLFANNMVFKRDRSGSSIRSRPRRSLRSSSCPARGWARTPLRARLPRMRCNLRPARARGRQADETGYEEGEGGHGDGVQKGFHRAEAEGSVELRASQSCG